jgi:hypothetical protein
VFAGLAVLAVLVGATSGCAGHPKPTTDAEVRAFCGRLGPLQADDVLGDAIDQAAVTATLKLLDDLAAHAPAELRGPLRTVRAATADAGAHPDRGDTILTATKVTDSLQLIGQFEQAHCVVSDPSTTASSGRPTSPAP